MLCGPAESGEAQAAGRLEVSSETQLTPTPLKGARLPKCTEVASQEIQPQTPSALTTPCRLVTALPHSDSGLAVAQQDWCPDNEGRLVPRDKHVDREDDVRGQGGRPPADEGRGLGQTLLPSGHQNEAVVDFQSPTPGRQDFSVCGLCSRSPGQLPNTTSPTQYCYCVTEAPVTGVLVV